MKLESIKVLGQIKELYEMPRTQERFNKYLFMLQGANKNEMILPIASFNPMGKELALEKLNKLIELNAEKILEDVIFKFNHNLEFKQDGRRIIRVAINLIDDIEGSWSNYYVTDYRSKFEIENLLKRNFCTPIFWTSESVTEESITRRIEEYILRTIFWIAHGKPVKLIDMLEQEIAVQMHYNDIESNLGKADAENMEKFISENEASEDQSLNLNFFYGDEGSDTLNYVINGIVNDGGFEYAKLIAKQRKSASC